MKILKALFYFLREGINTQNDTLIIILGLICLYILWFTPYPDELIFFFACVATVTIVFSIRDNRRTLIKMRGQAKYPSKSIAYIMNIKGSTKTLTITVLLTLTVLLLNLLAPILLNVESSSIPQLDLANLFFMLFIILINLRDGVMRHRIKKGTFGNNEYESRIIIQFVLDNQKGVDFNDGGKGKKIISKEDLEEIKNTALAGSPIYGFKGETV